MMWQTLPCLLAGATSKPNTTLLLVHCTCFALCPSITINYFPSARLQATGEFIAILDQATNTKQHKQQTMSSPHYASRSSRQLVGAPSKPIAIKRSDDGCDLEDQEEHEQHEKQFYECATWRMYNRIVDHRLHSPLQQAPIHQRQYDNASADCSPSQLHVNNSYSGCSPQQQGQPQLVRPKPRYARSAPLAMSLHQQQQYQLDATTESIVFDEEVFELEL